MEKRTGKIIVQAPGGTASKGSYTYKLAIPSSWIKEMGLSEDERHVELIFDGTTISITKRFSVDKYISINKAKMHDLFELLFYDGQVLCTKIVADYTEKTICVENYVDDFIRTAFGNNSIPTWNDYKAFLEDRCIPRSRAGLREYLEAIGVDKYDPLQIIKKTEGRMAEDNQWLKVEEIK